MFGWFHRKKTRDQEIDEELNYHLDLLVRERLEAGDSPTQAKLSARKRLGNKTFDESTPDLVVRASGDPAALAGTLRKTVRTLDRTTILSSVSTVEQQLAEQLSPRRFETWLLSLFSLVALALASLGIYGVIHYGVTQRTNEIGIRMALGAMPSDIQHLVIGEGLFLGAIGLGFGLAGAFGLTRFLSSLLYGVKSSDPLTFICVSVLLLSMAVVASSVPARRAARLDPMSALRQE